MKFTINADIFRASATEVVGATSSKASNPAYMSVLIRADKRSQVVMLTGQCESQYINLKLQAKVDEGGQFCVSADRFGSIAKTLRGDVTVKKGASQVTFKVGKATLRLAHTPTEHYPLAEQIKEGSSKVTVNLMTMKRHIKEYLYAVAHGDVRGALNGVSIKVIGSSFELASCDGQRLAVSMQDAVSEGDVSAVVPLAFMASVSKLYCAAEDETLDFIISDHDIRYETTSRLVLSRLIAVPYPDYKSVLRSFESRVDVDKAAFQESLKRVVALSSGDKALRVVLTLGQNSMLMAYKTDDETGHVEDELPISSTLGSEIVYGCNPQYLLDMIQHVDMEKISLQMNGPNDAVVLETNESKALVMPYRL